MGIYVYTPRMEVKEMVNGEKVARLGYAYKDFDEYRAPKSWVASAGRQESAGLRAADRHNVNGVKLLARGDKFEVGAPVYEVNKQMRLKYLDHDMGGMRYVGELAKVGRKWAVKYESK